MPISEAQRPYHEEMRRLARDEAGREVLVGLTYEETEWFLVSICIS